MTEEKTTWCRCPLVLTAVAAVMIWAGVRVLDQEQPLIIQVIAGVYLYTVVTAWSIVFGVVISGLVRRWRARW